jgi:hypothetical protein
MNYEMGGSGSMDLETDTDTDTDSEILWGIEVSYAFA